MKLALLTAVYFFVALAAAVPTPSDEVKAADGPFIVWKRTNELDPLGSLDNEVKTADGPFIVWKRTSEPGPLDSLDNEVKAADGPFIVWKRTNKAGSE